MNCALYEGHMFELNIQMLHTERTWVCEQKEKKSLNRTQWPKMAFGGRMWVFCVFHNSTEIIIKSNLVFCAHSWHTIDSWK